MFNSYIFEGTYLLRAAGSLSRLHAFFTHDSTTLKRPEPGPRGPRMALHMYDRRVWRDVIGQAFEGLHRLLVARVSNRPKTYDDFSPSRTST